MEFLNLRGFFSLYFKALDVEPELFSAWFLCLCKRSWPAPFFGLTCLVMYARGTRLNRENPPTMVTLPQTETQTRFGMTSRLCLNSFKTTQWPEANTEVFSLNMNTSFFYLGWGHTSYLTRIRMVREPAKCTWPIYPEGEWFPPTQPQQGRGERVCIGKRTRRMTKQILPWSRRSGRVSLVKLKGAAALSSLTKWLRICSKFPLCYTPIY